MTQSDNGSILRRKRIKNGNQRTKFLLLLFSLMMTKNLVILPNLLERTRAKVATQHLKLRRLNLSRHHRNCECHHHSQSLSLAHCRRLLLWNRSLNLK